MKKWVRERVRGSVKGGVRKVRGKEDCEMSEREGEVVREPRVLIRVYSLCLTFNGCHLLCRAFHAGHGHSVFVC